MMSDSQRKWRQKLYAYTNRELKEIVRNGIPKINFNTEAHQFYESKGFNGKSKKAFDMRLVCEDIQ